MTDYIIIDDDKTLFLWTERINLYITNYKTGLTSADVKQISKMVRKLNQERTKEKSGY